MADDSELETVLAELRRFGLKPTTEVTGKTHIRVMWHAPGKGERSHVVPMSGSDWRGRLNARAEVRRKIKADGISDPILEHAKKPLTKKIVEPAPHIEPLHVQVAQMRGQLDELTELVLAMAVDTTATRNIVAPQVTEGVPEGDLAKLPADRYITTDEFARRTGRKRPAAYQWLRYRLKQGEIELRDKLWRRLPKAFVPPPTVAVPVIEFVQPAPANGEYHPKTAAEKLSPGSWQEKVWKALPDAGPPVTIDWIADKLLQPKYRVSPILTALKGRGLAMPAGRGWWHRHDVAVPDGWSSNALALKPVKDALALKPVKEKEPNAFEKRHQMVLNAIPYERPINSDELAQATGKSRPATMYYLKRFLDEGLVSKVGSAQYTRWVRLKDGQVVAQLDQEDRMSEPRKNVLAAIRDDRSITRREIAKLLGTNEAAVGFHLSQLRKAKLIAQVGGGRDIGWARIVAGKPLPSAPQPKRQRTVAVDSGYTPSPGSIPARILGVVNRERPSRVVDIADKLALPLNQVSGQLTLLRRRGLILNPAHGLWVRAG